MTQDVFLKAFDRPPATSADVRLRPWLFRVATNACFNLIRGRRTDGPLEVEALPAAGDPYEQARTVELIERSLAGMNERYRAALVLKDLHGLDGSELAEVLDISRPAADVLVHRARASFRRAFAALPEMARQRPRTSRWPAALSVPAALSALPPAALAPHGPSPAGLSSRSGAAAAGAGAVGLAKITAGLGAKAAVVAAGAVVVAGGGIAAVELAGNGATTSASAGGVPAAVPTAPPPTGTACPTVRSTTGRSTGARSATTARQPLPPCRSRDERRALRRPRRRRGCPRRVVRHRPRARRPPGRDPRHDDLDAPRPPGTTAESRP